MIIAHDLGTSGNKASLHDTAGRMLATATVSYPVHYAPGGVAEQDPEDWWRAVVQATRELLAKAGVDPGQIAGLVVGGQMMGAVFLDEHANPVRPAIIWADTRSTAQADQLEAALGAENAYRMLGHRINPTYSIEKVMWVRDHEPDVWARVRHVALAKDFVVWRLTGRLATDRSDASSTNAYDQAHGDWSAEVLAAAEIDVALLPEVIESIDTVGELRSAAAEELGLAPGTRVIMGGGDGPLAAVGSGIVAPSDGAYVCLGTSAWVSFAHPEPVLDPAMRTFTFNNVVPESFVPTATMQATGASMRWIADVLRPGADGHASGSEVARLVAEAAEADVDDLYFLPYLLGERSPHWDPAARGAFLGLAPHHTPAHLTRAVMEGVAFNLGACIDAFATAGVSIERLDAVGGAAASDPFLQLLANVWGIPVRRRSVVEEANSLGAAVVGLVGLGLADFGIARELSEVTAEFAPDSAAHDGYRARAGRFADGYAALAPWFAGGRS